MCPRGRRTWAGWTKGHKNDDAVIETYLIKMIRYAADREEKNASNASRSIVIG